MQYGLLAGYAWIIDVAFFVLPILGILLGIRRGFVKGVMRVASKWVSLIVAFAFCVSFANLLEQWFHMTTAITNGIAGALAKNEAYAVTLPNTVQGADIFEALGETGIGIVSRWLIAWSFASVEIPAGTTPALLLGSVFSKWISIVISYILLILLIRFGAMLIAKLFSAVIDHVAPLRVVNQVLGGILGLAVTLFYIFIALMLCNWLPIAPLHAFIESSAIVGKIFTSPWFISATSYAISGQWFSDYLQKFLA